MYSDVQIREWPHPPGSWTDYDNWDDVLHTHMEEFENTPFIREQGDWCDAAREVRRLYSVATGDRIDPNSPLSAFFSSAAASGYSIAVDHFACLLRVSGKSVHFEDIQSITEECLERHEQELSRLKDSVRNATLWQRIKAVFVGYGGMIG